MADNGEPDSVCRQGPLVKVKTNKSKYFVLHRDSSSMPARLEYYDSKRHWDLKKKAKKVIYLTTCFSINAFSDSKTSYGMTLYTKDDSFQISFDNEEARDSWLLTIRALISMHRDARPMFEHVWSVKVRAKDLGARFEGDHRLCLNDRTVTLVRKTCFDPSIVFPLEVIRRCGHTGCFFNMEVGRHASTGSGEFWMEADDTLIAQNIHYAILANMNNTKDEDDFRPKSGSTGPGPGRPIRPKRKHLQPGSSSQQRGRSDSIDSRKTTSSLVVDDVRQSPSAEASRSTTPKLSVDVPPVRPAAYMDMSCGNGNAPTVDKSVSSSSMNSFSSASFDQSQSDSAYADMQQGMYTARPNSASDLRPKDSTYQDMTMATMPGISPRAPDQSQNAYMDMQIKPANKSKRPEKGQSFLGQSCESLPSSRLSTSMPTESAYLDMVPSRSPVPTKPRVEVSPYLDMVPQMSVSSSEAPSYVDMQFNEERKLQSENNHAYIDMTSGSSQSSLKDTGVHMDSVRSYLNESSSDWRPLRHYSVGSRPQKLSKVTVDQYVEMSRSRDCVGDKEKSYSVPHLMPLSLSSNPDLSHLQDCYLKMAPGKPDNNNDERPRTSSESFGHRPRGASWSQLARPRSSSHGQKQKPQKMTRHSSKDSIKSSQSSVSDYIDMQVSKPDAYVEMSPKDPTYLSQRKNSHPSQTQLKTSPPKLKAKAASIDDYLRMDKQTERPRSPGDYVALPDQREILTRRLSQPQKILAQPFPELTSSEEDVSHRSFPSSKSSSRSSLARGVDDQRGFPGGGHGASPADSEAYVDCIQPTVRSSSMSKPARVASYISEEPAAPKRSSPIAVVKKPVITLKTNLGLGDNYAEMSPADFKQPNNNSRFISAAITPPPHSFLNSSPLEQVVSPVDPYMTMEPVGIRRLPDISNVGVAPSVTDSTITESISTESIPGGKPIRSDASTAATSHLGGSGGSSGGSTTTMTDDPYLDMMPPSSQSARQALSNSRAPKKGICYLRQTSKDDIAPRPTKPLPCYIRHESFRSQQSYDGMEVGSSAVDNTDILSNLAACSEEDDGYGDMSFPVKSSPSAFSPVVSADNNMAPVSPIRFMEEPLDRPTRDGSSSNNSSEGDVPATPSSGVPCYITDESERKFKTQKSAPESSQPPPERAVCLLTQPPPKPKLDMPRKQPQLPPRRPSDEATKKLHAADKVETRKELSYVEVDHSVALPTVQPSPASPRDDDLVSSTAHYLTIDLEKTRAAKKTGIKNK